MKTNSRELDELQKERFAKILTALAERVRKLRKAKGLSGRAFADQVGINHATLVGIETGAINMSLIVIFLVAEALEVDIGVLLDGLIGPKVMNGADKSPSDKKLTVDEPATGKQER